jgi:nitrate/TMAO reductase-like tetraheme cytochrome c subunit
MSKKLWAWVGGAVVGLGIAYVAAVAVDVTGRDDFCVSCHTMKPMVDAFHRSVHGGNNAVGFKSSHCTDCHLPHESLAGYLVAKGISGTRDALAEFGIIEKVDFKENFHHMKKYTYDSGCLHCHEMVKEPEKAFGMSESANFAHETYWKDKKAGKDVSCLNCHNDAIMPNFAHPGLLDELNSQKEEKK